MVKEVLSLMTPYEDAEAAGLTELVRGDNGSAAQEPLSSNDLLIP